MFRQAAAGPFDEVVAKATDENLTAEDWGAIMEVVDRVASESNGAKEAVQSLIKRLAHRNANVQLYTLEVANALSQNCDKAMHRELASRSFTDALLRLANDRTAHAQVKSKVLERMEGWSDMFKTDADLGIMYDAYVRLKQANPALQPPSAPQKNNLTDVDRQKEEDELQMALKLSLQEEDRKKTSAASGAGKSPATTGVSSGSAFGATSNGAGPSSATNITTAAAAAGPSSSATTATAAEHDVAKPAGTTAATISRVRALYDFQPAEPSELEFKKGDVIAVLESVYKDWWRGSLKGRTGIFPLNYVEKLSDPTPEELQREAQMEAEVFAEIKNVEKLLTLLSAGNTGTAREREEDNEEIGKLYHKTLAIRPKLIKLIEKYSQKKDDFTQLNEKFIKARRDYEALLESSMSHPPQPSYHQYAMRPAGPHAYGPPPATYQSPPPQGHAGQPQPQPQPQEPQRFYTPGPQGVPHAPPQDHPQYIQRSPSPNIQPSKQGQSSAPFYLAGAEVPPLTAPPPSSSAMGHQPRDSTSRLPSGSSQQGQPPSLNTASPPPLQQQHQHQQPQHQQPQAAQRTQSIYGAQELATSVYDSPVGQQQQQQQQGQQRLSGVGYGQQYSQDHYVTSPVLGASSFPGQQPQQQQPYAPASSPTPPPPSSLTPAPLQIGAGRDARHDLPSQSAGAHHPQYRAYVPGTMPADEQSQPSAPSAPNPADYYRV